MPTSPRTVNGGIFGIRRANVGIGTYDLSFRTSDRGHWFGIRTLTVR